MPLLPGTTLGPYEIITALGAGGMGEVYTARDTRLNRLVAIKRLKSPHDDRFTHEARAIAALNHPHICQIYDVGPDYLVLELVQGQPLHCPYPPEEAVRLAVQMASALEAAHRKHIIHRDLKPSNILVTEDGNVKLLDFGLARLLPDPDLDLTRTSDTGRVMGTVPYMSPEQAQGKSVDERSDIFSFGAVLYEMTSGRRAFDGDSAAEILAAILRDEPRQLQAPPSLDQIVTRCLRKSPAARFPTATELKAALQQVSLSAMTLASIAVLPFADMSPGKDHEWFGDGLAEEIITALSRAAPLKVIARTSAFAFKNKTEDVRRIAETLGVAHVLEGSVRTSGTRVRVTAQLVTAADGSHLWTDRYDRELSDVFAIQDDIAQSISSALRIRLSPGHSSTRRHVPTPSAHEAYLKGRHHWAKLTPESLTRSREFYERAIAIDPEFALAHNYLGEHFFVLAANGLAPAAEMVPQARAHVNRALEIDPDLPEAHAILGVLAASYDYDWTEAASRFARACTRNSGNPYACMSHGSFYLLPTGRYNEAVAELERALEGDPLNLLYRCQLAAGLDARGSHDQAGNVLRSAIEVDDEYWVAQWHLALNEALYGGLAAASLHAERAHAGADWSTLVVGLRAGLAARTGDRQRLDELEAVLSPPGAYGIPAGRAVSSLVQLDADAATAWLGKAVAQRDTRVMFLLRVWPMLASGSGWPAIATTMNLP